MTRYPYNPLPQFDTGEMHPKAVKSITISKETKSDGSVVRRKETLLADGSCLVDERLLSKAPIPAPGNIRLIPVTIETPCSVTTILPLHASTAAPSKLDTSDHRFRIFCKTVAFLLLFILFIQVMLFYFLNGGVAAVILHGHHH